MTINDVKKALCTWLNTNGLGPAIVTPTSRPAPSGKYIAVRDLGVEQFGSPIRAKTGFVEDDNDTSFMQVAEIVMTEVEGEGDTLREIRNRMQLPAFRSWAETNGITIWDIGSIMNNDTTDGEFWVCQKAFTFSANFVDRIKSSTVKALSAGVSVDVGSTYDGASNFVITEDGDFVMTEDDDFVVTEYEEYYIDKDQVEVELNINQ